MAFPFEKSQVGAYTSHVLHSYSTAWLTYYHSVCIEWKLSYRLIAYGSVMRPDGCQQMASVCDLNIQDMNVC